MALVYYVGYVLISLEKRNNISLRFIAGATYFRSPSIFIPNFSIYISLKILYVFE